MPERHVSELLGEFFRRSGIKRAVRRAEAVLLWTQVAGADVARFAQARTLRDGVLYVDVADSETAMHLSLQRQRFLDVYHSRFDSREVRDIRFRVGRPVPPEAPEAPPAPARPDPSELADLTRALGALELPDEVAGAALRAGRAMLGYRSKRLAEGWVTCPTCGTLTPAPGPCDACRRYAEEGRVLAASRQLAIRPGAPTPELSEEERAVAVQLASQALDATITELLPQVLGDPGFKPVLERAARCRAALATGKTLAQVNDADLERLPERVRRVLGALG